MHLATMALLCKQTTDNSRTGYPPDPRWRHLSGNRISFVPHCMELYCSGTGAVRILITENHQYKNAVIIYCHPAIESITLISHINSFNKQRGCVFIGISDLHIRMYIPLMNIKNCQCYLFRPLVVQTMKVNNLGCKSKYKIVIIILEVTLDTKIVCNLIQS